MAIRSKNVTTDIALRQALELAVATKLIDVLIGAGYSLAVDDSEEGELVPSKDKAALLESMGASDEETLRVYHDDKQIGDIFLVYGNDGWDLISDYYFQKKFYPAMQALISGIDTESFTVTLV
jgi:hypothetical protein